MNGVAPNVLLMVKFWMNTVFMSYSYHGIGIFYDGEYRSDYCNKIIKHTLVTTGRGLMSSVGEEQCTIKLAWLRMFENVYNVGEGEVGGGESTIHGQHRH